MSFFRFIPLSKISVACILIISATSSSASNHHYFLQYCPSPTKELVEIMKNYLDLYRFLAEELIQAPQKYQHPTDLYQEIFEDYTFEDYTTSPIIKSYLGRCKLRNTSISLRERRDAIAWDNMILHFHKNGKVTGWILGGGGGTTYNTVRTSDDITGAFLGEFKGDTIELYRVTKEGKPPQDGWEKYNLNWNHTPVITRKWKEEHFYLSLFTFLNHTPVIAGTWSGFSKYARPENQEGNVRITMSEMDPSHSFDMNASLISCSVFSLQDNLQEACLFRFLFENTDKKELSKRIEDKINKCIEYSKDKEKDKEEDKDIPSDSVTYMRFPYMFNYFEQEQVMAFYVNKAWEAYEPYLTEDIKNKKDEILNFRVNLKHQIYSESKTDKEEKKLPVPMNFGKHPGEREYQLNISTGTFFTDEIENEERFKSRVSLIAHEVLGHGIFYRYYGPFIEKEAEKLFKECSNPTLLTEKLQSCITKESAKTAITEGLAVAVEYAVYQHEKKMCVEIEDFMDTRYRSEQAAVYRLGINYLRQQKIITENGKLDFDELYKRNELYKR